MKITGQMLEMKDDGPEMIFKREMIFDDSDGGGPLLKYVEQQERSVAKMGDAYFAAIADADKFSRVPKMTLDSIRFGEVLQRARARVTRNLARCWECSWGCPSYCSEAKHSTTTSAPFSFGPTARQRRLLWGNLVLVVIMGCTAGVRAILSRLSTTYSFSYWLRSPGFQSDDKMGPCS